MGQNDTRQLMQALMAKGFTVDHTGKGVWIIKRGDEVVAALSVSPTDLRALQNALKWIGGDDASGPDGE